MNVSETTQQDLVFVCFVLLSISLLAALSDLREKVGQAPRSIVGHGLQHCLHSNSSLPRVGQQSCTQTAPETFAVSLKAWIPT